MGKQDLREALSVLVTSSDAPVTKVEPGFRALRRATARGKGGRPAKQGERFPSGKLKKAAKAEIEPIAPALWDRLKTDATRLLNDSRFGSELGRLSMHGNLSSTQTAAGFRIGQIYGRFERFKGMRRSAGSASYMVASSIGGDAADAITPQMLARSMAEELINPEDLAELEEEIHRAERAFAKLQHQLKVYPPNVRAALELLCVDDGLTNPAMVPNLQLALDELATTFRIKAAPKDKKKAVKEVAIARDGSAHVVPTPDKAAWLRSLAILRPDLSEGDLSRTYALTVAMKVREVIRRGKGDRPRAPECRVSEVERVRQKVVRDRNARLGKICAIGAG